MKPTTIFFGGDVMLGRAVATKDRKKRERCLF